MKRKIQPLILLVIFIVPTLLMVLPVFERPVMAANSTTTEVIFLNKNPIPVTLYLKGPMSYTIIANTGITTKLVKSGEYTISANFCGMKINQKFSFTKQRVAIKIGICPMAKVTIRNDSDEMASGSFQGPSSVVFSVPAHSKGYKVYLLFGAYNVHINACGKSLSGRVTYGGNYDTIWINCGVPSPRDNCSPVIWDSNLYIC